MIRQHRDYVGVGWIIGYVLGKGGDQIGSFAEMGLEHVRMRDSRIGSPQNLHIRFGWQTPKVATGGNQSCQKTARVGSLIELVRLKPGVLERIAPTRPIQPAPLAFTNSSFRLEGAHARSLPAICRS